MPDDERYEVFAIRYGRRDTRKSEVYLNYACTPNRTWGRSGPGARRRTRPGRYDPVSLRRRGGGRRGADRLTAVVRRARGSSPSQEG